MICDPTKDRYVTVDEDYLTDLRTDLRCAKRDGLHVYADELAEQLAELEHSLYRIKGEQPTAEQWSRTLRSLTADAVADLEALEPGGSVEMLVLNKGADLDSLVRGVVTVERIEPAL